MRNSRQGYYVGCFIVLLQYIWGASATAAEEWDIDGLLSNTSLFEGSRQILKRDALEIEGIHIAPVMGDVYRFVQHRHIAILSKPLESSGHFLLNRENKACWSIERPFPVLMIISDEGIYQRNRDGSEQVMGVENNPLVKELALLFTSVFSGDMSEISLAFDVYLAREGMPKGGWLLGLKPKGQNLLGKPQEIRLVGDSFLRWVSFVNARGDRTTIAFSQVAQASPDLVSQCGRG